jgi:hypothetical protein
LDRWELPGDHSTLDPLQNIPLAKQNDMPLDRPGCR